MQVLFELPEADEPDAELLPDDDFDDEGLLDEMETELELLLLFRPLRMVTNHGISPLICWLTGDSSSTVPMRT